jgi:hypothetical protein
MSLAVLRSRALAGMEALCVSVEVHLANGLPSLTMLGTNEPIKKQRRCCACLHTKPRVPTLYRTKFNPKATYKIDLLRSGSFPYNG